MPPALLMALTKVWMAAFWAPNSVSPANPKFDANDVRFDTGKTTLIELAVTPRVLVDASFTPTPLGLPSPNPLSEPLLAPLPPADFFGDDVPATANTAPPMRTATTTKTPTCMPTGRRRSRRHDRLTAAGPELAIVALPLASPGLAHA